MSCPLKKQKGQAIIFILLVTVAAVFLSLSMINMGIATSDKMQMQNAADATAYSISTLEARDLNFTAYTNRAMVSNEVAMGQMVGLMSWAAMGNSTPGFLNMYFSPLYPIPVVGQILAGVVNGLRGVFGTIKNAIVRPFTKVGSKFIPYFNKAYSVSQRFMHLATLYFSGMTLFDIIDANADDTQMSLFGYLTLARHMNTYYGDLDIRKKYDTFVTSYRQDNDWNKASKFNIPHLISAPPSSDAQKEGMSRLAALINSSRDPFSKNRDCSNHPVLSGICNKKNGGWAIPLFPPISFHPPDVRIKIPFVGTFCIFCVDIDFSLNLERKGGSDLRYTTNKKNEQHYVWTAADLTGMAAKLSAKVIIAQVKIPLPQIRADLPFGIGAAQSAKFLDQIKPYPADKTLWPKSMGGKVVKNAYGNSPKILPISWAWPAPAPGEGSASFSASRNNINRGYGGLPRYNDTKRGADPIKISKNLKFGFEAPYLLIALEKKMDDVSQANSTGRFKLYPNAAAEKITAIGKSEVYFSRPNDLFYYSRGDGAKELANGFNPYWEARLVDTSYLDRTSALAIQQGQPWLPSDVTLILTQLQKLLSFIR